MCVCVGYKSFGQRFTEDKEASHLLGRQLGILEPFKEARQSFFHTLRGYRHIQQR